MCIMKIMSHACFFMAYMHGVLPSLPCLYRKVSECNNQTSKYRQVHASCSYSGNFIYRRNRLPFSGVNSPKRCLEEDGYLLPSFHKNAPHLLMTNPDRSIQGIDNRTSIDEIFKIRFLPKNMG